MVRISKDRIFQFGKYAGISVADVIKEDPSYIEFLTNKFKWLFNDFEKQMLRNVKNRNCNKDIHMTNVNTRTSFEEEMYRLFNR